MCQPNTELGKKENKEEKRYEQRFSLKLDKYLGMLLKGEWNSVWMEKGAMGKPGQRTKHDFKLFFNQKTFRRRRATMTV